MLSPCVLLNILEFMNRDDLERVQITSRLINDIVLRHFASKPLRLLDAQFQIKLKDDQIIMELRKFNSSLRFCPNSRKWNSGNITNRFFPIEQMRPFLTPQIGMKETIIFIEYFPYTTEHILALESLSHVWSRHILVIKEYLFPNIDPTSLSLICQSSNLLQCTNLSFDVSDDSIRKAGLLKLEGLFKTDSVAFSQFAEKEQILEIVRAKAAFPEHRTTIEVHIYDVDGILSDVFEIIREEFFSSKDPYFLQMTILLWIEVETDLSSLFFRVENNRTKEVLELRYLTESDVDAKLISIVDSKRGLLLKRSQCH